MIIEIALRQTACKEADSLLCAINPKPARVRQFVPFSMLSLPCEASGQSSYYRYE